MECVYLLCTICHKTTGCPIIRSFPVTSAAARSKTAGSNNNNYTIKENNKLSNPDKGREGISILTVSKYLHTYSQSGVEW